MGTVLVRDAGGAVTPARGQDVALVDLLDRLLAGGVVIVGDVTISLADVDLVHISLRALISSVQTLEER
ncbi:gas vesicle protein GvpA [Pseudonocardia sp. CNS-004]|nr:gas vesicle protein GvpA [Pseudonocardia sp. CNS-004]